MKKQHAEKRARQPVIYEHLCNLDVEDDSNINNPPRPGKLCPRCKQGLLDYNGVLNLACPVCGHTFGGCFT